MGRGARPAALLNMALGLHQQGQLASAKTHYQDLLALDPRHFDGLHLLGVIEYQHGNYAAAAALIRQAIEIKPAQAGPYSNLGLVLRAQLRHDEALECFAQAIERQADHAEAHNNHGNALRSLLRYEEALSSFQRALQLKPDYAVAYSNRANVLQDLKRYPEALENYAQALRYRPDYAEAHNNLAHALRHLNQTEAALASCARALQLQPDYAAAHLNAGNILQDLLRHQDALACYQRAEQLQPDYAEAHLNEALCRLTLGDFAPGWEKYEWRWASATHRGLRRDFSQPLWLGHTSLHGKTLLLHAEQGLGDTLQFCRYVPQIAALGATVVLEVQAPLRHLLQSLAGVTQVVVQGEALPPFDFHCPLLSLPLALRTELPTIPAQTPYLRADQAKIEAWRRRLAAYPRPWIGLTWSGNPTHVNDHNRSIPLAELAPLFQADASFIGVQTQVGEADRDAFARFGMIDVGGALHDFSESAALLACLDQLITVDTAALHLAGALALPATLMLPYNADFRWLTGRADSPWYPTVTLVRQPQRGAWHEVAAQVAARLGVA
jgi:tetratricopeptide (TPR) repeat protein